MEAKHTVGPWRLKERKRQYIIVGGREGRVVGYSAEFYTEARQSEALANARLFFAAPRLLHALREAKSLADAAVMSDDPDGSPSTDQGALIALRALIDAALAEAEGHDA